MKKLFLGALLCSSYVFAQISPMSPSVERSITGVQVGFLGANVYNESRLTNEIALRSSATLNAAFWFGDLKDSGFALAPELSLETKYYYNLERRARKGKSTARNSGNYISLDLKYFPDWFVISSEKDLNVVSSIGFVPTYGIRREFGRHFNYEFKVGFGYGFLLDSDYSSASGSMANLSFKIGYDF